MSPFIADLEAERERTLRIDLPYPHKLLWPNGSRGSRNAVAGEKRKHKEWATDGAIEALALRPVSEVRGIHVIVHPKAKGPLPDKDNCIAALKVYQDAISKVLGIDDRHFPEPTVAFADTRTSRFVVEVQVG